MLDDDDDDDGDGEDERAERNPVPPIDIESGVVAGSLAAEVETVEAVTLEPLGKME